jgi:hypothetical protein
MKAANDKKNFEFAAEIAKAKSANILEMKAADDKKKKVKADRTKCRS